jgi:hypothetical protein
LLELYHEGALFAGNEKTPPRNLTPESGLGEDPPKRADSGAEGRNTCGTHSERTDSGSKRNPTQDYSRGKKDSPDAGCDGAADSGSGQGIVPDFLSVNVKINGYLRSRNLDQFFIL